jgi:ABC-type phosphate transport system permease subunit
VYNYSVKFIYMTTEPHNPPQFKTVKTAIKILFGILALIVGFFLFVHFSPTVVQAAPAGKPIEVCQVLGGCIKNIEQFKPPSGNTPESFAKGAFKFILLFVTLAIYLASALSVVFIVLSGYKYITSQGDEKNTKPALETLKNAVFGLILALLSLTIVTLITQFIGNFQLLQ